MIQIVLNLAELCLLIGLEVAALIIGKKFKGFTKSLALRVQDTHCFVLVLYLIEENLRTTMYLR